MVQICDPSAGRCPAVAAPEQSRDRESDGPDQTMPRAAPSCSPNRASSWPLALLALIAWPFVWLVSLSFRLGGVSVGAAFGLVEAIIQLSARLVGGPNRSSAA